MPLRSSVDSAGSPDAADVEVAEQLAARAHRRALRRGGDRRRGLPAVLRAEQRQRRRRGDDLDVRRGVEQRLVTACVDRTPGVGLDHQDRDLGLGQRGRAEQLVETLPQPFAALRGVLGRTREIRRPLGRRRRRRGVRALHQARRILARARRAAAPAAAPPPSRPSASRATGARVIPVDVGGGGRRGGAMPAQTNIMSGSRPLPVRVPVLGRRPRRRRRAARTAPGSGRGCWPGTRR